MERLTEKTKNKNTGETIAYRLKTGAGKLKALQKLGQYEDKEERGFADWIPAEVPPDGNRYIISSFSNFNCPSVGRYEADEDGGVYYVGDEDVAASCYDVYVDKWMELPKPYRGGNDE